MVLLGDPTLVGDSFFVGEVRNPLDMMILALGLEPVFCGLVGCCPPYWCCALFVVAAAAAAPAAVCGDEASEIGACGDCLVCRFDKDSTPAADMEVAVDRVGDETWRC